MLIIIAVACKAELVLLRNRVSCPKCVSQLLRPWRRRWRQLDSRPPLIADSKETTTLFPNQIQRRSHGLIIIRKKPACLDLFNSGDEGELAGASDRSGLCASYSRFVVDRLTDLEPLFSSERRRYHLLQREQLSRMSVCLYSQAGSLVWQASWASAKTLGRSGSANQTASRSLD